MLYYYDCTRRTRGVNIRASFLLVCRCSAALHLACLGSAGLGCVRAGAMPRADEATKYGRIRLHGLMNGHKVCMYYNLSTSSFAVPFLASVEQAEADHIRRESRAPSGSIRSTSVGLLAGDRGQLLLAFTRSSLGSDRQLLLAGTEGRRCSSAVRLHVRPWRLGECEGRGSQRVTFSQVMPHKPAVFMRTHTSTDGVVHFGEHQHLPEFLILIS
jgi:hypothetical protein